MTTYPERETIDLTGIWDFRFREKTFLEDIDETTQEFDTAGCVPGDFDALPETFCKRGCGIYRRTFSLEKPASNALLRIGGIGLRGRFRIDGREVGFTNLPYSGVNFETGPLSAGKHTIHAVIDNNFSPEKMKLFLPYYDFFAFGGFHRGVDLLALPEGCAFDRVQVRTTDFRTGKVSLRILLRHAPEQTLDFRVRFDTEAEFRTISLLVHDGAAETELAVPGFKLWSPESPALHTVEVAVPGDRVVETFGVREIVTSGKELMLNGKPLFLKGFNRHESHPSAGAATTSATMLEDLQNLKALNCNFIRGCHYPQSQEFLDLCDRMGFLVWEESLGWGNAPKQLAAPEFMELQEKQTRLMVRNSINHPSVIIWAFLNEFASNTQEGLTLCKQLVDAIHEEDSSRPVSFACNHVTDDICCNLLDVVAFNTYPGWIQDEYNEEPTAGIRETLDQIIRRYRSLLKTDKPIMVSEMGTCGIYGQHDRAASQWSEEFQAEYLSEVIRSVAAEKELRGLTIWQMNDAKSYLRTGANIRCKPLAYNLAGVFDPFRRTKLAAATVAEGFARLP